MFVFGVGLDMSDIMLSNSCIVQLAIRWVRLVELFHTAVCVFQTNLFSFGLDCCCTFSRVWARNVTA